MKTLTFRLPETIEARLNALVQKSGLSRSEIIRRALIAYFSRDTITKADSFFDLSKDLMGSIDGPPDLSSNKAHLESYGHS